jgi:hypothetical protein
MKPGNQRRNAARCQFQAGNRDMRDAGRMGLFLAEEAFCAPRYVVPMLKGGGQR